jgi:type II secretory ATPase GspE/PulE/Tfp pilus assembly ATPase PilB-like protein
VTAVLNVRLIRKLCEKCKEGYAPPAEVLKQLGLPAGRVEALYRPPTEPIDPKHPEVVCDACQGIGYVGRTGIFELLLVTDEIREVLQTKPKLENLRAAARKAKHRSIQEEGVLLVARGVTSLPELVRVLKQ